MMNVRQHRVQQQFLNDEGRVITHLNRTYTQAHDEIVQGIQSDYQYINELTVRINALPVGDPDRILLEGQRRSRVYRVQYQRGLEMQVDRVLNNMTTNNYLTVSDYLQGCYENGFLGTMYDLHGQGIPLVIPVDQTKVTQAVQLDSKISQGLYNRLGEDVPSLKRKIMTQVSLSMVTGQTYTQCAERLAAITRIGFNNSVRITRTEGHRIQCTAAMDAMEGAKDKGADILKVWDATLDGRTRESHRAVDGEIRELTAEFSNGLQFPGDPDGRAAEVISCRCAVLQRARWALDAGELQVLKDRAEFFGLDKDDSFEEFKVKYLKAAESFGMPLQTFATSQNTMQKVNDFTIKLQNGEIPTSIKWAKQYEHVPNTSQRQNRIRNDIQNNKTPSSYFLEGVDVFAILPDLIGKGDIFFASPLDVYPVEYITLEKVIGKVYNSGEGKYWDTRRIAIKYSSKGIHAYPVKDW